MEIPETGPITHPESEPVFILSAEAQYYLQKGGQWANFLGIMGFILCGLIVIFAFFATSIFSMASQFSPAGNPMLAGMGAFITVIYILVGCVYFFPSLYLYQFGNSIKNGILFTDAQSVTKALSKLKSFFKFWGIFTIVIISFYILIIVAVIVGAGIGTMMHHS